MAQNGINYFYTGVLGLNQDSLKVFYDFNSGSGQFISSVPIGNPEHSGFVAGFDGFLGGISRAIRFDQGSGIFRGDSYIKIQNSTGLFSKNATFIVTQEKTGSNGGTIFSNFEGNNFKSGYHFGINDANKFYWGYQDNQNPIIKTALTTLSDKNAFAVKLEENNVSFCYYNNNTLQFEKSSWGINSDTLLPSDQWFIGTGKNLKSYDHIIDNFIYVNRALPDSSLIRLFSGLWNESYPSTSGYLPYETGQITGRSLTLTGVTGILNTTYEFSGNQTGTVQREIYQYEVLTGNLNTGDTYLTFLDNLPQFCANREEKPIYFENISTGIGTGITGLGLNLSETQDVNVTTPIYQEVVETGFLTSGYTEVDLFNTGNGADMIFVDTTTISGDIPYLNSFGMKSVSYLGQDGNGVFESLSSTGTPLQNYYNKLATYNFSNLTFQTEAAYNSGYVDVFLNGLIQSTGGYSITGEFFNQGVEISGDYFISGRNIYFKDSVLNSDILLYDIGNSGDKLYFESGDYSSSGTLPVSVENNMFFLTGRKLFSGIDYFGLNGFFAATEETQSISGEIRTIEIRDSQNYLNNLFQSNRYDFSFSADFISGTTGTDPSFEIISGIYDGDLNTPDLFTGASGQFVLDTGIFPTGFYDTETGIVTFPSYTGWQIYSGSDIYDIRVGIDPLPPTEGWQNGTEFLLGWKPTGVVGLMTGQTFLRDTSINWLNGVRLSKDFLEHGSVDLLNGNQISKGGLSGFFNNNTEFWN